MIFKANHDIHLGSTRLFYYSDDREAVVMVKNPSPLETLCKDMSCHKAKRSTCSDEELQIFESFGKFIKYSFFLQKVKASLSENYMTNARGSRTSRKPMNIDIDVALPLVCLSVTLEAQDENFIKMTNCSIVMITPFSMSSLFSSSPLFPLLTLTVRLGNGENVSMIVLWNIFVKYILC